MSNVNISKLKGIVGDANVIDSPSEMAKYLKGQVKGCHAMNEDKFKIVKTL